MGELLHASLGPSMGTDSEPGTTTNGAPTTTERLELLGQSFARLFAPLQDGEEAAARFFQQRMGPEMLQTLNHLNLHGIAGLVNMNNPPEQEQPLAQNNESETVIGFNNGGGSHANDLEGHL